MTKDKIIIGGNSAHNTIAYGTRIEGTVYSESDFRIDGEIKGDFMCRGKVIIGQNGQMKGNLKCGNAEIVGRMQGSIEASDVLVLKSSASLEGDIFISTLVIEPNAQFNGTCKMKQRKAQEAQAPAYEEIEEESEEESVSPEE